MAVHVVLIALLWPKTVVQSNREWLLLAAGNMYNVSC